MKLASPSFKGVLRCPLCYKPRCFEAHRVVSRLPQYLGSLHKWTSPLFLLHRDHARISEQQCGMETDSIWIDQNFEYRE